MLFQKSGDSNEQSILDSCRIGVTPQLPAFRPNVTKKFTLLHTGPAASADQYCRQRLNGSIVPFDAREVLIKQMDGV